MDATHSGSISLVCVQQPFPPLQRGVTRFLEQRHGGTLFSRFSPLSHALLSGVVELKRQLKHGAPNAGVFKQQ